MLDKNKTCGIYYIKNKLNGKMYIGYSNNIERRIKEHLGKLKLGKHDNSYIQKTYDKNNIDIFSFGILEECEELRLQEREIYYIKKFKTNNKDIGYNLTSGGDGIKNMIRTWGNKISDSKKGVVFSKEHIENLVISHLGYIPTEIQKERLRIGNAGKKKGKNTSSKYVGVSKRGLNRWRAYIVLNRKQINLGNFNDEKNAAKAYDKKFLEMYKDSSKLNFPNKGE